MSTLREAAQQALEALQWHYRQGHSNTLGGFRLKIDEKALRNLRAALAQQPEPVAWVECDGELVWNNREADIGRNLYTTPPQRPAEPVEPVACEPQYANDDGWCDWVCPKPIGYLMQCCGCGLIHEVESRVAKYKPRPSEEFEVVGDPDLQVQWRMKRRDDISPKQKTQEPVAWRFEARHIDTAWVPAVSLKRPGPEHKYMRNVIPLYTTPPQRKPLTEEEIEHIGMTHQSLRQVVRAVEKASWEKNNE